MLKSNPFKWRHYEPEIILLCVRWYLTYPLSYRQVAEMVNERGMTVHHTTLFRVVLQKYFLDGKLLGKEVSYAATPKS